MTGTTCLPTWSYFQNLDQVTKGGFYSVAPITVSDVWAVGSNEDTAQVAHTLTEHFDGTKWTIVPSPDGGTGAALLDVAAVSAANVWAVGRTSGITKVLIEHWDGTAWTTVPGLNPSSTSNILFAVSAVSASDIWAVGRAVINGQMTTLIEHWNGLNWMLVPSPNVAQGGSYLFDVSARAANDVWAVGNASTGGPLQPLVEHWDGTSWSMTLLPGSPTGNRRLTGVAAVGPADVWAVGGTDDNGVTLQPLIQHYDGTGWSMVSNPPGAGEDAWLLGVAAGSGSNVWAVGSSYDGVATTPFAAHFDGSQWAKLSTSNPAGVDNALRTVAVLPGGGLWAVGARTDKTLAERFCPISVGGGGFVPATRSVSIGSSVVWQVPPTEPAAHQVADGTGMSLFDSNPRSPGGSFSYDFRWAGIFTVSDPTTGATSTISIPMGLNPVSGDVTKTFTVSWGASGPPVGDVFDVQIKRPGTSAYVGWRVGTTAFSDVFSSADPKWTGPGTYSFRARLRAPSISPQTCANAVGACSLYSPILVLTVTAKG